MMIKVRNKRQRNRTHVRRPSQLRGESLESRQMLAVVTSLANSGPGTLREAVAGTDEIITFAVSGTINTSAQIFINRNVTIDGTGQDITVHNITSGQRIFNLNTGAPTVTLRNLTITGGTILDTGPSPTGGAIRVNGGNLTLEDCTIENNIAREGGAIGMLGTARVQLINSRLANNTGRQAAGAIDVPGNATLTVNGSTIESNSAGLNSSQTFLAIGGGIRVFGSATITDSMLRNNTAATMVAGNDLGYGGAIGVTEGGSLNIDNTEISGNLSERGGGISARGAAITITDSVISGNTSVGNGGGIRIMRIPGGNGNVTIENTLFRQNRGDGGGGIGLQPYANSAVSTNALSITGSTFDNNYSLFDGGGIEQFGAEVTIENSTFSGNTGANDGGGIWSSFSEDFPGSMSLQFSTLTGNSALNVAGGVYSGALPFTLGNTLLSANAADVAYNDLSDYGLPISASYNLVSDGVGSTLTNGVMGNIVGMTANLGPLMDNGGLTPTHMLMAGPGVDAADPAATVATDQRGFLRPGANAFRDMGAVEQDGTSPSLNLDFNNDGMYNCDDMNLLEAAIDAGTYNAAFDVNQDSMLDKDDVFAWLMDAGEIRFGAGRFFKSGDANLDGVVDGQDFIVWNSNKFTPAKNWCLGDFNQDDVTDGQDFILWNSSKFTSSDAGRGPNLSSSVAVNHAVRSMSGGSKWTIQPMVADRDPGPPQSRTANPVVLTAAQLTGRVPLSPTKSVAAQSLGGATPFGNAAIHLASEPAIRHAAPQAKLRESIFANWRQDQHDGHAALEQLDKLSTARLPLG